MFDRREVMILAMALRSARQEGVSLIISGPFRYCDWQPPKGLNLLVGTSGPGK